MKIEYSSVCTTVGVRRLGFVEIARRFTEADSYALSHLCLSALAESGSTKCRIRRSFKI